LSAAELEFALAAIPAERVIYSFRKEKPRTLPYWTDCPLELGDFIGNFKGERVIRSLHERKPGQSVEDCARRIEGTGVLKLSIEIRDFDELEAGHRWMMQDPTRRAFLPRSIEANPGRWAWYRAWTSTVAPISFFREDEGSSPDQPTFFDWMKRREKSQARGFAAVLGDPVVHSRTPIEHAAYFTDAPVFAIRLTEEECDRGALDVLVRIGLRYAAVTAPLKEKAARAAGTATSINTLFFDGKGWKGRNTDLIGFKKLAELVPPGEVAVWGGGGTLEAIRESLPRARFFSARTGEERDSAGADASPRAVIWAVGRSRKTLMPPSSWRPEVILDLNYAEDSPGREYALLAGAKYVSGLAMFQAQAQGQREFWNECK
jgi:shikimate 5-dehydrogenase